MKNLYDISAFSRLKRYISLMTVLVSMLAVIEAQDTTIIRGIVRSHVDQPVANVAVSIEGSTQLPSITNEAGEFSLFSVSGQDRIIISPTGDYKMRTIYINNRDNLVIYLTSDQIASGDDPISILSQISRRRDIIPAVSGLNTSDRHHTSAISIDQHMQGRIPGLNVVNRSGTPGSGAVTTLRGINSIHATNQPMYIIDGIPLVTHGLFNSNLAGYSYNPLLGVNPFDISVTTILKDPAINAVYGSKGSNGIILIETLDPSITQTSIEVDLRMGYSLAPSNLTPQLDAGQHKTLMNEVLFSSGLYEEDIQEIFPSLFYTEEDEGFIDYQHNTNWQELIFNNSVLYNLNVKVKGGDEIARYGLSFGYMNSDGIIETTGYEGYNLRFVSKLNIFTWMKMEAGVSLNYNASNLKESAVVSETSPILAGLAKSPLLNPFEYDIDGNELTTLAEVDEIGISNPLAIIQNYAATNNNYNFTSTLGLEGTINKDLSLKSKVSFTYDVLKELLFQPNHGMELYYNKEAFNVSKASNNDLISIYSNTYLGFDKRINRNHHISSFTGISIQSNKYQFDWGLTKNAHENDEYRVIQDGQENLREIGGQNRAWNWISVYENLSYSFKDKYLLTASISLDGSSRIGENAETAIRIGNNPFGIFYAGGIAWRLSNEAYLKNLSWLEDFKLRFTAGITGNDDIGESSATDYYQAIKFRETVGLYPALIVNDKLTYETVAQINTGLDLSLLGNRFTTSVDYFISTTHDMVIYTPIEDYLGYDFLIENGGTMQNKGWEVNTFVRFVDGKNFKMDFQVFLTSIENEVLEIKGDKLVYSVPGAEKVNMKGSPANSFYGYVFRGVFTTQAEADNASLINKKGLPFLAGDAIYEDLSGPEGIPDGIINEYDKTTIGSTLPDYFGGWINSFSYKELTLSASFQFVFGNEVFNYVRYQNERMTGLANQSNNVLNRWQYDGQITDVPRATWGDPIGNSDFSTRWIEDGSYLRIRNITLSYRIPSQFLAFKNAEFYISANNLFSLNNYLGYDPEFAYSHSQMYQGIDYGLTPQPRQFIAGIKIGL